MKVKEKLETIRKTELEMNEKEEKKETAKKVNHKQCFFSADVEMIFMKIPFFSIRSTVAVELGFTFSESTEWCILQVFEKWKEEQDKVLKERLRKQTETENKLKQKKELEKQDRKNDASAAFTKW